MSMPPPSWPPTEPLPPVPPPPGAPLAPPGPVPSPRRGRAVAVVVVMALLAVAALAGGILAVRARQDANDQRDRSAALSTQLDQVRQQVDDLRHQLDDATTTTVPAGNGGSDNGGNGDNGGTGSDNGGSNGSGQQGSGNPLQDLLQGLLGQGGDGQQGLSGLQGLLQNLLGGAAGAGGSGAAAGLDPQCLAGEGGLSGLLGNLTGNGVSGTPKEQVDQIVDLVQQERGLTFSKRPEATFLAAPAFDQRVADEVKAGYPVGEADLDSRTLALLGAIPAGTDLKALQEDLLSGQVAGFYDPATKQIVVRVTDDQTPLDTNAQITLAHELDHALTDDQLGLPDTSAIGDSDANLARLGLVEGDATLLMQRFALKHIGLLSQLGGAMAPDVTAAQDELDKVAPYLRNELMFPYLTGLAYTCRLDAAGGGWKGVDAAYKALPRTTAQLLFADGTKEPVDATDPGNPGGSWAQARKDTLGAAPLQWLLTAPGGDEKKAASGAADAVQHWAGGETVLYTNGPASALGVSLVDTADGGTLCTAVRDWYGATVGAQPADDGGASVFTATDRVGVLRCDGRAVRLGIAPDRATADALVG